MFDEDVTDLDVEQTLAAAGEARMLADRNEAFILALAALFADLHPATGAGMARLGRSLPGMERPVILGGDGTPEVAEFAAAELGAELEISTFAATRLIGDALELRHRLPGLWTRVHAGEVRPWIARKIAAASTQHASEVAAAVNANVTPWTDSVGWARLEPMVAAAIIAADSDAAEQRARRSAEEQGVWVNLSNDHGIGSVFIKSETPNIVWFDATIDRIADDVADQHDHSGRPHHDYPSTGDWAAFMRPSRMQCECGCHTGQRIDPARLLPPATLYLHLNEDSFTRDADGVARFEGHGPITIGQARDFLAHCHVTIKPVIDLHNQAPVDAYEIPDRLREAVQLRSPADVFPYATNVSRSMDQDHTGTHKLPRAG